METRQKVYRESVSVGDGVRDKDRRRNNREVFLQCYSTCSVSEVSYRPREVASSGLREEWDNQNAK